MTRRVALVLVMFADSACRTAWTARAGEVRALVRHERFDDALRKAPSDGEDRALSLLVRGALLQDAGEFERSDECLREASDRLADSPRRTVAGSVTRHVAAGDAGDWIGEDYERVWVHVLGIFNRLARSDHDGAMVEVRKLTRRLVMLEDVKGPGRRYRGDAFAHWLSGLLYEDDGSPDDAFLSFRAALAVSGSASPLRTWLCADLARAAEATGRTAEGCVEAHDAPAAGQGEIVLFHRMGLVPERTQTRTTVPIGDPSQPPVTLAVPDLRPVPSTIAGSLLRVDGARVASAVVTDLEVVAMQTLEDERPGFVREAVARNVARRAAMGAAGALAREGSGGDARAGTALLSLAGPALDQLETVDLRNWYALPARVAMARAFVPAGTPSVAVSLLDASGRVVREVELGPVQVVAGRRTYVGIRSVR